MQLFWIIVAGIFGSGVIALLSGIFLRLGAVCQFVDAQESVNDKIWSAINKLRELIHAKS